MNRDQVPLELPDELSDEAAAQIVETLLEITRVIENHYAGQIMRYYEPQKHQQRELWTDNDPPF